MHIAMDSAGRGVSVLGERGKEGTTNGQADSRRYLPGQKTH